MEYLNHFIFGQMRFVEVDKESDTICLGCLDLIYGPAFNLDFKCAMALFNDELVEADIQKAAAKRIIKKGIIHFSHIHPLTRCMSSSSTTDDFCRDKELEVGFTHNIFFGFDPSVIQILLIIAMLVRNKLRVSASIVVITNAVLTFTFHVPSTKLVLSSMFAILIIFYIWGRALLIRNGSLVVLVTKISMSTPFWVV
ncbi:hypothetical protein COLO4_15513 [Corchorus olitorius]|uniref:Uncharacterized protein n=1 Tax=Corchorus olitorius TaxID=93759 RepID=A0A1R3JML0_9ROSI|nr:hypothetical protein COLO4_15513 [Corchorus olitorius]